VFVEQKQDAQLACAEICPSERNGLRRHLQVRGMIDATIRFYTQPGSETRVFQRTPDAQTGQIPYNQRLSFKRGEDSSGPFIYLEHFTGDLMFGW
jgi:hypothetical protein